MKQIASLYMWTSLLPGLCWVISQRNLLDPAHRTILSGHLVEVVALLDMPCWTVNRVSASMNIWGLHVAPYRSTGIEQCSGIPYSLLNLINDLEGASASHQLLDWSTDEVAGEFVQVHWWEAVRLAAVLHSRMLCSHRLQIEPATAEPSNKETLLKLFASLDAICSKDEDHVLARAGLYPLFIGGLVTKQGSLERNACESMFVMLRNGPKNTRVSMAFEIVQETWRRKELRQDVKVLFLATEIASERGIELYLY